MNYVVPDIHNDNERFSRLIERIKLGTEDHIFLLGDLFDRCSYNPDPVGVYFTVLGLEDKCTVVSGNHDRWLAEYIREYYGTKERKRKKLPAYYYNSFELMTKRLPEADMLALADWLLSLALDTQYGCECIILWTFFKLIFFKVRWRVSRWTVINLEK